jgi:hypothetical protein
VENHATQWKNARQLPPISLGYPENYRNFCKVGEQKAMPNWVFGVLVIVGLLAVALLRESLRMTELKGVAAQRGFLLHSPFVPGERPPMRLLAERAGAQANPRWAAGLTGVVDGTEITIAEHEVLGGIGKPGAWHVLLAWRIVAAPQPSNANPWPHGGELIREGDWAAWRLPGKLTKANIELMLTHLPEARARF